MPHRLFHEAAHRYDLHTPAQHYRHDHEFVIRELKDACGPSPRVLDVGCGTGVLLGKAQMAGICAFGTDASSEMVAVARKRVGDVVRAERMQELSEDLAYDAVVCLSWSFNYCESLDQARDILTRMWRATRPGGRLILQIAHAPHATGRLSRDTEPGPDGQPQDVLFLYRFRRSSRSPTRLFADYVYACHSQDELFFETHQLEAADAHEVAALAGTVGYDDVTLLDSWRREPFATSISPFLLATRPG